jgi:hypothetical protein
MSMEEPNATSKGVCCGRYRGVAIYQPPMNENGECGGFYCDVVLVHKIWRVMAASLIEAKNYRRI